MVTLKIPCPVCGQKVSGDESFYGAVVTCPVCGGEIRFPDRTGKVPAESGSGRPPEAKTPSHDDPHAAAKAASNWDDVSIPMSSPAKALGESEAPPQAARSAGDSPGTRPAEGDGFDDEDEWDDHVPSPLLGAMAFVSSILGIVTCVGGILFAPLAIIFGHTALARGRHSPVRPAPGHFLAVAGVVLGYLNVIFLIASLAAAVFFGDRLQTLVPTGTGEN